MHTLSIAQIGSFVKHVAVELDEPVMILGQPGAGKTQLIYQVADDLGALIVDVRLGQYDSVDLRGIPVPDIATKQTTWFAPLTLPFKGNPVFDTPENRKRTIILFLDEFNQCHNSVFGVAMQITNERRCGEHELMDNVRIVCAGNRDGDKGVTNKMPTTICNRLIFVEATIDHDEWCYHMQDKVDPIFIAFIQFRSPLLNQFNEALKNGHKSFATPRTWEKAAKVYASKAPMEIKQAAMAGAVGQGPSAEFWGFHDVWLKMTPISEILKNPDTVKLPDEAAMRYAVTVAVSGAMDRTTVPAFHTYLMRLDPEFAILAWQLAMQRDESVTTTKEFIDFSKKYRAVFARD